MGTEDRKKRLTRKNMKKLYEISYSFLRKIKYDHVSSFAGHAALFLLMSLFPMAMYCISMFNYLPIDTALYGISAWCHTGRICTASEPDSCGGVCGEYDHGKIIYHAGHAVLCVQGCLCGYYRYERGIWHQGDKRDGICICACSPLCGSLFSAMGLMMVLIVLGNNIFNWLLQFVPGMAVFGTLFKYGKYLCMLVFLILFFCWCT